MFLVVRLWDAFADLLAGRLVDRTMTRWGKFRPFIMFGAIPLLIFIKYPLNDARFKQIRDETEARKLAAIKAHHEDPEAFITPDHAV